MLFYESKAKHETLNLKHQTFHGLIKFFAKIFTFIFINEKNRNNVFYVECPDVKSISF